MIPTLMKTADGTERQEGEDERVYQDEGRHLDLQSGKNDHSLVLWLVITL
jgi:hypothetical protein